MVLFPAPSVEEFAYIPLLVGELTEKVGAGGRGGRGGRGGIGGRGGLMALMMRTPFTSYEVVIFVPPETSVETTGAKGFVASTRIPSPPRIVRTPAPPEVMGVQKLWLTSVEGSLFMLLSTTEM
jgi:hypothetical protein